LLAFGSSGGGGGGGVCSLSFGGGVLGLLMFSDGGGGGGGIGAFAFGGCSGVVICALAFRGGGNRCGDAFPLLFSLRRRRRLQSHALCVRSFAFSGISGGGGGIGSLALGGGGSGGSGGDLFAFPFSLRLRLSLQSVCPRIPEVTDFSIIDVCHRVIDPKQCLAI
jgi:hypothetical protein